MFTKAEIRTLKKARANCILNARCILGRSDGNYPMFDDIKKAEQLLDLAERIDKMILAQVGDSAD